jgi:Tfp pilus assembly protein PilN
MTRYNEDERTLRFGENVIIRWGTTAMIMVALVVGVWYWALPHLNNAETQGLESSFAFVSTKRSLLIQLVQDVKKLESQKAIHKDEPDVVAALEAQKKSTIDRIRSEAGQIPTKEVPDQVVPYL